MNPTRRHCLALGAALIGALATPYAGAQTTTPIKFQLDWRFEGPSALFLLPTAKGYFKQAGLDVTVDAGNGSGGTVTRIASGSYDMGFADMAALMEFHANNPDAPNKPVAVMMVYNNTPAAAFALKKSGIAKPGDLTGKKLGAPVFDAGRRAFPIFAKANGIGNVAWTSMDPPLRETMLVRGDVDAITGFSFTSLLNLEARGVKPQDVNVMNYADYGVKLYGNAIIASPKLIKENPAAVKAFLVAFAKGAKDVMANPAAAIEYVKQRDGIVNVPLTAMLFTVESFGAAYLLPGLVTLIITLIFAHGNSVYRSQREYEDKREIVPGYSVRRINVPHVWAGHSLSTLGLRNRYDINVIGMIDRSDSDKKDMGERIRPQVPINMGLRRGDLLIVLGENDRLDEMMDDIRQEEMHHTEQLQAKAKARLARHEAAD